MRPEPDTPAISPSGTRVFERLVRADGASRSDLARELGLTPAAVTRAVRPLLEAGLLTETDDRTTPDNAVGRPAMAIALRAEAYKAVGLKLTADHVYAAVCDLGLDVLEEHTARLQSTDPTAVVDQLASLVETLQTRHPEIESLGVALAGDVNATSGQVALSPYLGWRDLALADLLTSRCGLTTTVENDVRALLTGERWYGVGRDVDSLALVTVGAGIGCALLVNGHVVRGSQGVSGEISHILVDPNGPACDCGNRGCVSEFASSRAIQAHMAQAGHAGLSVGAIAELARAGQPDAVRILTEAGRAIGIGIATVANLFGPQLIVITGEAIGTSSSLEDSSDKDDHDYDVMDPEVRRTFTQFAFGTAANAQLDLRQLRWIDWARGAAACAVESFVTHYGRR